MEITVEDGVMDAFIDSIKNAQNLATLKRIWQEGSGFLSGETLKEADAVKEEMKRKLS